MCTSAGLPVFLARWTMYYLFCTMYYLFGTRGAWVAAEPADRSSSSASIRAVFGVRPSASRAMWRIASSSRSSASMVSMSRMREEPMAANRQRHFTLKGATTQRDGASIPRMATVPRQRAMPLTVCVIAFGAICAACGSDTNQTNLVHSEHISKRHSRAHGRSPPTAAARPATQQGRLDHFLPGRQPRHLRGERDRDGLGSGRGLERLPRDLAG